MSWLANLDARASKWPSAAKWPYRGLKWTLVAVGVYAALGLAYIEVVNEHRIGLGSGIAVAVLLAGIKGIAIALRR